MAKKTPTTERRSGAPEARLSNQTAGSSTRYENLHSIPAGAIVDLREVDDSGDGPAAYPGARHNGFPVSESGPRLADFIIHELGASVGIRVSEARYTAWTPATT